VRLFAMYDRTLLMEFLRTSESYAFEKVSFFFSFHPLRKRRYF
jgi:hypothetical protein